MENGGADAGGQARPSSGLVERPRGVAAPSKGVEIAAASAAASTARSSSQQNINVTAVSPAQRSFVPVPVPARGLLLPPGVAAKAPADARAAQWSIASRAAVKIDVASAGWYRVTQPELAAAGLPGRVDPSLLQLFVDGVEQPLRVNSAANGRFTERDSVEFYATGADTPYTATRTYWIVAGDSMGQRIPVVDGGTGGVAGPSSFPSSVELKPREIFFGALINGDTENFSVTPCRATSMSAAAGAGTMTSVRSMA